MTPAQHARIAAFLVRPALAGVLAALNGDGEETRVVGGAVRDLLLDAPVGDVDLASTALPEEVIRRARAAGLTSVPTGIEHGTVTLLGKGEAFEVTTLRSDIETDGRRATVAFGRDFTADAQRRDFTINAMSLDRSGALFDVCDGLSDLAARRIRFIGDPARRIAEDYLRILRFFRFHARYGQGPLHGAGIAACIAGRGGLERLSRERVRAEMMKLLVAPGAVAAVDAMAGAGLLLPVLGGVPHVSRFAALAEGEGGEGVYPAFRLAALAVSVREDAERLRERLRLSNDEFDRISRLAAAMEAVAGEAGPPTLARLRHLAHRVGADAVAGALVLLTARAADSRRHGTQALIAGLGRTPPFLPTGRDVIGLGVRPGREVGRALEQARADWIEAGCPADAADQAGFVARAVERLTAT